MPNSPDLWLFFLMVLGVIALPGMDMAFVGASTLAAGVRGGLLALAGVITGGVLHVVVAATGMAAVLAVWPALFNALLLAGTAYMLWLGWGLLHASPGALRFEATASAGGPRLFVRGVLTCLANPKAYVFMLAIFPAFMPVEAAAMPGQALRLGGVIALTQALVYGAVVLLLGGLHMVFAVEARQQRGLARVAGFGLMAGAMLTLCWAWRPLP